MILEYRAGLDDVCKLRVVGSWYSMTGYAIALPKGIITKIWLKSLVNQGQENLFL
jgi:hypothetical protein